MTWAWVFCGVLALALLVIVWLALPGCERLERLRRHLRLEEALGRAEQPGDSGGDDQEGPAVTVIRADERTAAAVRAAVAEEIARAIEQSARRPDDCAGPYCCPDCVRWHQCQEDAAMARRIGGTP